MTRVSEPNISRSGVLQRLRTVNIRSIVWPQPPGEGDFCIQADVGLQRLPAPYWLWVALCTAFLLFAQGVEYSLRGAASEDFFVLERLPQRLAVPLVFLYILVAMPMLKAFTVEALTQLRPVVRIPEKEYDAFMRRMVCVDLRLDVLLLLASTILVVLLLAVLGLPTPMGAGVTYLPAVWWQAGTILLGYSLLGWVLLLLLFSSIRLGSGLGELAQKPLTVNVLDPTHLLPFGHLSLRHSLTLVGLILVLILPLGRPTEMIDYLVIVELSLGSVLSLILPLRGVHTQIRRAKLTVLRHLSDQFFGIQQSIVEDQKLERAELETLSKNATDLDQLRRLILSTPTWPFRNVAATVRAVLTAMSPLLYFLITELMRTYMLPLFTG
jgi:hypothetical protein